MHAGIFKDALLVVDASLKPEHGSVVVAEVDGCRVVRRLHLYPRVGLERLEGTGYVELVDLGDFDDTAAISIFGVVKYCVNEMRGTEFDDGLGM